MKPKRVPFFNVVICFRDGKNWDLKEQANILWTSNIGPK